MCNPNVTLYILYSIRNQAIKQYYHKATANGFSMGSISQIKLIISQSQLYSFYSVSSEFKNKFILSKRSNQLD